MEHILTEIGLERSVYSFSTVVNNVCPHQLQNTLDIIRLVALWRLLKKKKVIHRHCCVCLLTSDNFYSINWIFKILDFLPPSRNHRTIELHGLEEIGSNVGL